MAEGEKLVRDKLDARIPKEQLRVERDPAKLRDLLVRKLGEELGELRDSRYRDPGEYADVVEVLLALAGAHGVSEDAVHAARGAKLAERGGFRRGLVWTGAPAPAAPVPRGADARSEGIPVPPPGHAHVYADGACSGNPGPGGWGAVVVTADGRLEDLGGGDPATTNNRMELLGATAGLARAVAAGAAHVVMYLDSTYVRDGITRWVAGWKRNSWRTADGSPVKNQELWQGLDAAAAAARSAGVSVGWEWVKGHAGHPGNERADAIARRHTQAARR